MPKTLAARSVGDTFLSSLFAVGSVAGCAVTPGTSPIAAAPTTPAESAKAPLTPGPTRTPLPDPYEGVVVAEVDAQTVRFLKRDVGYLAVSADSVWVATNEGLVQIDPKTLKPQNVDEVATVRTCGQCGRCLGKRLWRGNRRPSGSRHLQANDIRGDPDNPNAIAIIEGATWVAQHRGGTVTRLRETSGEAIAVIEVGPAGSSGPQGVAGDATAVWVGVPNIGAVVRIDPSTNKVVATVKTNVSPCGGIGLQPDAVWVSSCFDDQTIMRIDPRTNTLAAEIDIGGYNGGPVLVDGYPWFPVYNQLVRIDPATNRIDRIVKFAKSAEFKASERPSASTRSGSAATEWSRASRSMH